MKWFALLLFEFVFFAGGFKSSSQEHVEPKTLPLGSNAPDFNLKGVDGKMYSLKSFSKAKILVIIFSSNHCPTAQAYEERIKAIGQDYKDKGVQVVMINPNNANAVCLEEMGYSDLGDSFEEMKIRAKEHAFNFPYLDDGEEQKTAMAYGPVATPHVFIFDGQRILRYCGRIDDKEKIGSATHHDTSNAIEALLAGKEIPLTETKVFGCSIKWKWKNEYRRKLDEEWAKKQVPLEKISLDGVRQLVKNDSKKLRVIDFWATWCGPCIAEFSGFVETFRMYQARDFELVTVCLDKTSLEGKVKDFLTTRHAAFTSNYLFGDESSYELIEAVDPLWKGNIPFTLMVEPGGKIVKRFSGGVDMNLLRKSIVENPLIGRYY